jgi:hypothetical protein
MCGLLMVISLCFNRIATADNHQRIVCIVGVVSIIIDTSPLIWFATQLVNEETGLATSSNSTWLHDPTRTARACYWHAIVVDVCSTLDSSPHIA